MNTKKEKQGGSRTRVPDKKNTNSEIRSGTAPL